MIGWLKQYEGNVKKRNDENKEIAERHNRETMDILKQFVDKFPNQNA
jgi:hypothetical protein